MSWPSYVPNSKGLAVEEPLGRYKRGLQHTAVIKFAYNLIANSVTVGHAQHAQLWWRMASMSTLTSMRGVVFYTVAMMDAEPP